MPLKRARSETYPLRARAYGRSESRRGQPLTLRVLRGGASRRPSPSVSFQRIPLKRRRLETCPLRAGAYGRSESRRGQPLGVLREDPRRAACCGVFAEGINLLPSRGKRAGIIIYLLNLEEQRRNKYGVFQKVKVARGEDAMQADAIHAVLDSAFAFKNSWLR